MSRIPPGFSRLAADLLDELIEGVEPGDALSTRHARLAELGRDDEARWHRITAALDSLIAGLRAREAGLARGEIRRPAPSPPTSTVPAPVAPAPAASAPSAEKPAKTADYLVPAPAPAGGALTPPPPPEAVADLETTYGTTPAPRPVPAASAGPQGSSAATDHLRPPPPPASMLDLDDVLDAELEPGPGAINAAEAERTFHERKTVIVTALSEDAIQAALDEQMAKPPIVARREAPPPPPSVAAEPVASPPPVPPARSDTRPPATPESAKGRDSSSPPNERVTKPEPISAGWTRRAELLFEDALRLFRLGDVDGGLISLERLLVSGELNADLREFVDVNQDRILEQYETLMSPWQKVPELLDPGTVPGVGPITALPKIARVLGLVNGRISVSEIAELLPTYRRLEVISAVSQLIRFKVVNLRETS